MLRTPNVKMSLLSTHGSPSDVCPYMDRKRQTLDQTAFHACSKCLDTEEFMRDFLKCFESSSGPESADAFFEQYKAAYKKPILPSQLPTNPAPSVMRTSVLPVPEIRVPITADVHASYVIEALKGRYEAKTYIEHLIALNHYTKNFASMIIKDPTLKNYEEVARASRMNVHDYRRSQVKFNARGLAQAKAQTVVDETISRLPNKEAILQFLAQMYKTTLEELKTARHESTPRYEENLRKLFHEASTRAIAERITSGASSHEEMLHSSPCYKSICALGAWKAQKCAGLPPMPITTRETYLDELETYWAFFDADGKVHAFEFAHAWSWLAGRKVDLRYGEGEKVWFYPEMEIMEI
ncbi:hypothetical protein N7G274_003507 [Stereocaulon virgatum]|uniref:Uncharacterized protein n=1 Tax=Stereocaulon virgatum TaxID=373712 RepID=A0ABR4ADT6_9LECA